MDSYLSCVSRYREALTKTSGLIGDDFAKVSGQARQYWEMVERAREAVNYHQELARDLKI
jgi:hypothetical protein